MRDWGAAGARSADRIDPLDEDVEPRQLDRRDLPFTVDPAVGLPVVPRPSQAIAVGGPYEHVLHRPDAGRLVVAGDVDLGLVAVVGGDERPDVRGDALHERIETG